MRKQTLLCAFVFVMLQACGDISCTKKCDPTIEFPNPGVCADYTKTPGDAGGPCKEGFRGDYCNDGLACVSGACLPCGGPGQACCDSATCPNGGTCESNADGFKECNDQCGQVGQPCCTDNHCDPATGTCDVSTKTCVAQNTSCTFSPLDPVWNVPIADKAGCGELVVLNAPTYEQAVKCIEPEITAKGWVILPLPQVLDEYLMCNSDGQFQPNSLHIFAFSSSDAYTCAQALCAGKCTTTAGACAP